MTSKIEQFFDSVAHPLVIVSAIPLEAREVVTAFLERLNTPVYLEGISGIREESRLQHLRITYLQNIWDLPIDGIFRLGTVPTPRFWRDLENKKGEIQLLSYTHLPWAGVSWGEVIQGAYSHLDQVHFQYSEQWYREPVHFREMRDVLLEEFPQSEPGMIRRVSEAIPHQSLVYLGNSLPIREWDLAAVNHMKNLDLFASRGMNGIDGQLSTFLGMTQPFRSNWCILGDLTTLYDLAAPWILEQLQPSEISIVVINNGGGMIFSKMSDRQCLQNQHTLGFEHFAKMWNLSYQRESDLHSISKGTRLIELVPCLDQTEKFWASYARIKDNCFCSK